MPILLQYMLKLSISLAIMYLFYQLVLRRLTFYNHNRWYLFGYSVLCFIVSAINISPILEKSTMEQHDILLFFPSVEKFTANAPTASVVTDLSNWSTWDWLLVVIMFGCLVMLLRLSVQLISFKRMVKNARLITDEEIKFYQVNKNIIPFSFGNAIFINQQLHTEAELKEIIKHEFVHVKQLHTIDIVWAEILCILNWYNPFGWLIRKAIRQNLEFIADSKVLEKGMDKKRYQYLLLKVIGDNHFSIASQFNFSSLKKRIVMMNTIKTARIHMVKFLFILPLLAALLLSFRSIIVPETAAINTNGIFLDTIPAEKAVIVGPKSSYSLHRDDAMSEDHRQFFDRNSNVMLLRWKAEGGVEVYLKNGKISSYTPADMKRFESIYGKLPKTFGLVEKKIISQKTYANTKGYIIDIKDNNGSCTVVVKNKEQVMVRELLLTEWNSNEDYYRKLYGEIPSPLKSKDLKKEQANSENEGALINAKTGDYLITAQTIIIEDKKRNVGLDSVSISGFPNRANSINIKDFTGLVLVNGKEVASEELDKIKPDEILEISVYKKTAVEKYGDKGKNGVILITSKKQTAEKPATTGLKMRELSADLDNVLYFINGQESSKEVVEMIDPAKIQSIDVLKGKSAEKKYGEKGKGGVIEITIPITSNNKFIEKAQPAAWDIRNVLPKKKEEC